MSKGIGRDKLVSWYNYFITPSPASMFIVPTALDNIYHIVRCLIQPIVMVIQLHQSAPLLFSGPKDYFLTFARFLQSLGADLLSCRFSAIVYVISPFTLNHFLRVNFGLTVGVLDSAVVPTNWLLSPSPLLSLICVCIHVSACSFIT